MNINLLSNYNPSFQSKRTFKRLFDKCAYSGEAFENKDTRTLEHIKPASLGGTNEISNFLVVKRSWNMKRSSFPLDEFIKNNPNVRKNIIKSVNSMEGKIIDGINWSEEVRKTLKEQIGFDIFL